MRKFLGGFIKYDETMDPECVELCDTMNCLPGIVTFESCCGHGKGPFRIWFKKTYNWHEGLFFLTRCADGRYWKYGYKWKIVLTVGDQFEDNYLPVHYMLESEDVGADAYEQAIDLVDNMNHHLNHDNFIKHYELQLDNFSHRKLELGPNDPDPYGGASSYELARALGKSMDEALDFQNDIEKIAKGEKE
jgi:hypothetical protein